MRARVVVVVVALALLCAGCDWLQWGNGPGHPGSNFEPGVQAATLAGLTPSPIAQLEPTSPAVIANGLTNPLAIVERDGALTAFDAKTYAVVWSAELPEGSTAGGAPAINGASNTVFVTVATASNPVLLGFDVNGLRNCSLQLNTCLPVFSAALGSAPGPATPPLVSAGRVFAAGGESLFAFDAAGVTSCSTSLGTASCSPLWSATTGFAVSGVGPAAVGGQVFAAVHTGVGYGVRAYNEASGAPAWTGTTAAAATATPSLTGAKALIVPTGAVVEAFAFAGCGQATCAPQFQLLPRTGDPAGSFLGSPAVDGGFIYATRSNGSLSAWPAVGCSAPTCQPSFVAGVNAPIGGSSTYAQTPIVANGNLFLLAQRDVGGVNHAVLVALNATNGNALTSWDLGVGGFGAGLANPSVAWGIVYVPTDRELVAVHPANLEPLAALSTSPLGLSPAFSPSVDNYVLRCTTGTNSISFTMTAIPGGSVKLVAPITTSPSASQTVTVPLLENQAAVVQAADAQGRFRQYWVRCLPADFPPITVTTHPSAGPPTPGWYLMGNNIKTTANGYFAMVLDTNGTPVWYRRTANPPLDVTLMGPNKLGYFGANNRFDIETLAGGQTTSVGTVGIATDPHELLTLPNGNTMLMSYPPKSGVDLTGLNATPTPGPNSTIVDCVLQEIDPAGQLVWQWTASDHIDPVTEPTLAPQLTGTGPSAYDVYHCNSIDAKRNGDLLVSARHLNAVFEIRRSDGLVTWKLGGKPTNKDGAQIIAINNDPSGSIVLMHDARYMPSGNISIFDNQAAETGAAARGVEFSINFSTSTAEPVFWYPFPGGAISCCMGSFRKYPDGHRVIGWGWVMSNPRVMTELNAAGDSVLDISLASGNASYRAVKVPPTRLDANILRQNAGRG